MKAVVTNSHHFSKGVTLTIDNGILSWRIDWNKQRHKFGSWPFEPKVSNKESGLLDPVSSIDDFVMLVKLVFEFTGCFNNDYYKIKSNDNVSFDDIINCIYNTPLDQKVKFIQIGTCGCNMGHCGAITGISIDPTEYQTYGDLMALFGDKVEVDGHTYYEYPDSVWFSLEKITELPEKIHEGFSCYNKLVPINIELDPNTTYLAWSFGR